MTSAGIAKVTGDGDRREAWRTGGMALERATCFRHRFPSEIIGSAVWPYHVFILSLWDVELILAQRGVCVTHESARG